MRKAAASSSKDGAESYRGRLTGSAMDVEDAAHPRAEPVGAPAGSARPAVATVEPTRAPTEPTVLTRAVGVIRRVPYTTGVVVAMILFGLAIGAFWRELDGTVWWDRFAYGLPALRDGRVWTPITGSLLAEIPTQYIPIGAVVILGIGLCEWRLGTRVAVVASIAGRTLARAIWTSGSPPGRSAA
jgi:hypothetical protein